MAKHYPAKIDEGQFNCPFCGVFAKQIWGNVYRSHQNGYTNLGNTRMCSCQHCFKISVWHGEQMVIPSNSTAPLSHAEMPEPVSGVFEEARVVFGSSPKSSSALLRLALQRLCVELGLPGKNLNDDIGALVAKGLPVEIQQSLDVVRVIGNNAVHPGEINIDDNVDIAAALFELVNSIVEDRIARPKKIAGLYATLPESVRKKIEERNARAVSGTARP